MNSVPADDPQGKCLNRRGGAVAEPPDYGINERLNLVLNSYPSVVTVCTE
jgi:hypothetical protein